MLVELKTTSDEKKKLIPVLFFCRYSLCDPQQVSVKAETIDKARALITQAMIPSCLHGKMHSAPMTRLT
jgi:hypothetical protein